MDCDIWQMSSTSTVNSFCHQQAARGFGWSAAFSITCCTSKKEKYSLIVKHVEKSAQMLTCIAEVREEDSCMNLHIFKYLSLLVLSGTGSGRCGSFMKKRQSSWAASDIHLICHEHSSLSGDWGGTRFTLPVDPAIMSRYLRHFTTVGDDQPAELEEEELHVASEELSPATGQFPTTLTFRDSLQRLYSSDRFQVCHSGLFIASTRRATSIIHQVESKCSGYADECWIELNAFIVIVHYSTTKLRVLLHCGTHIQ